MNLLERIRQDADLQPFIVGTCDENDISVLISDKIDKEDYLIIKVDNYYNNLNIENRPASPDCLIIQKCKGVIESYAIALVELKGIETTQGFDLDNMSQKFTTCFEDFMSKLFSKYFDRDFNRIELFLSVI
ncbi:MAG: hypothetical protein EAZ95_03630 [Bacteroidetes bacterium]|nr:MAG: hypothetical protein EAZ95_03630 [Bacteroidota bacterium]